MDEARHRRPQALLATEQYQDVRPVMITTYERGKIDARREIALLFLETKSGPVSPKVRQRIEALSPEELRQLLLNLMKGQSLKDLGLED